MKLCMMRLTCVSVVLITGWAGSALGDGIPAYQLAGSFNKPAGAFDLLNDGRMVVLSGSQVLAQQSPTSSVFVPIGSVSPGFVSGFGASFVDVSPDGSTLAIGNGEFGSAAKVGFIAMSGLSTASPSTPAFIPMDGFDSVWLDDSSLLVTGTGTGGSSVSLVQPASLSTRTIISNIDGSVGGVATGGGWLFTSNGFDFDDSSGSSTGDIRATSLVGALAGPTPIDFENGMVPVAKVLSGSFLAFDGSGNLLVGGGDVFGTSGDVGYAAVLAADAVSAAALGGPLASVGLSLQPSGVPMNASTALQFNAATGELLYTYYDNNTFSEGPTVYRYVVPSPGVGAILLVASGASLGARRRNRAACSMSLTPRTGA